MTYSVSPNILMPDRYVITPSGSTLWLLNPKWDSNNASCDSVEEDSNNDIVGDAKRKAEEIMTGRDPGPEIRKHSLVLFTPPVLNGVGSLLVLIAVIFFFARKRHRLPT